jgi:hypothetical protein
MMPVEEIRLTAKFRVDFTDVDEAAISEIYRLFAEYQGIVNELIEHAHLHKVTSFISLHHAKYRELRQSIQRCHRIILLLPVDMPAASTSHL